MKWVIVTGKYKKIYNKKLNFPPMPDFKGKIRSFFIEEYI